MKKGFSLVELLGALTMGLALVGVLVYYYTQERNHQSIIEGRSEAIQSAEAILRIASREMRAIPGNTREFQDTTIFKIFKLHYNASGNDSFCYFADVYPEATFGNGSLDTVYETFGIVYDAASKNVYNVRYSAGALVYNLLIPGVESFDIIPYDVTGAVTANNLAVTHVELRVTTYNQRAVKNPTSADTITFSRVVTIRSRM
ncbi:hypothetical protein JXA84_02265 [candidate division WOR-3 bacterium]|nr:hypothetical protein [candidate division WOR-3 bacterium]